MRTILNNLFYVTKLIVVIIIIMARYCTPQIANDTENRFT